jgi:hypothetical protein
MCASMYCNILQPIEIINAIVAVVVFAIAAFLDWRYREIPVKLWIPPILIGFATDITYYIAYASALNMIINLVILQILLSTLIVIIVGIIVFVLKLMGGADFFATLTLYVLYPFNRFLPYINAYAYFSKIAYLFFILPPLLHILIIYSLTLVLLMILNFVSNVRYISLLKLPKTKKTLVLLFYRVMTVEDYMSKKFYYPIYIPGLIDRLSFNIYEDDEEWKKKLQTLPKDMIIVASWGLPMITFFSIALFVYVAVYMMLMPYCA